MDEITLKAPAKLNLCLDITSRRNDGYHLIETVMTSVDLCDVVTIKRGQGGEITVGCSDADIPKNEGNICHKAARLFFEAAGIPAIESGAEIFIEKNIPHKAGLGGGSSDAAAVLRGLNELYGCPVTTDKLLEIGLKTGADVPFCLVGGTKICRGIGEIISDCPELKKRTYLIVMPDFGCDTKGAYEKYDQNPLPATSRLNRFFGDFPRYLYNIFEELYQSENIREIKERLIENGAENACLTGSGAAVFGVFETREKAERAQKAFSKLFTAVVETVIP